MKLNDVLSKIDNEISTSNSLPDNFELTDEAKKAYELILSQTPVTFITGRAGTGKTTFIQYLRNVYKGNLVVLAPTGMTAINIKGQTIHSFFRFPPRTFEDDEISNNYNKIIDQINMIIIDEVSMVQSDLIDHIDFALRKWKKNQVAFGGVQLVLVGDCFQLSPWIKFGAEKKRFETKYKSQWFFDAYALQNIEFEPVNFTKIFRQKDPDFIRVLNRLRINRYSDNDIQYINDICFNNKNIDQEQIILTTINEHADNLNKIELDKINSEIRKYNAKKVNMITDEITKTIPECLELKVGAKVVITKNINGAVNGSLAIVKEMYDDRVKIEVCDTKKIVVCTFEKWEQFEYEWDEINKKISSHKIGEYSQIPLRLGWAITIHKSQGLTFNSIKIDLTKGVFAPGQTYVALSRCKTLNKISLVKKLLNKDIIVEQRIIDFYTELFC
jgi:ATP-dependent exoDNAse (exonuclease V) alpha subunit